jgi:hypothetical protein
MKMTVKQAQNMTLKFYINKKSPLLIPQQGFYVYV